MMLLVISLFWTGCYSFWTGLDQPKGDPKNLKKSFLPFLGDPVDPTSIIWDVYQIFCKKQQQLLGCLYKSLVNEQNKVDHTPLDPTLIQTLYQNPVFADFRKISPLFPVLDQAGHPFFYKAF